MSGKETYKWFIVHIAYRNESNVKSLLDIAGLEYYMPFKSAVRIWKDNKIEFQAPVIQSCTFVRVSKSDFIMLQMMKEISLILYRDNRPLSLSEEQMEAVRQKIDASDNPGAIVLDTIDELINK